MSRTAPLRRSARIQASLPNSGQGPSLKRKRIAKTEAVTNESVLVSDEPSSNLLELPSLVKKVKKTMTKKSETTVSEAVPPSKRKRMPRPEPVYIISDVEKKETTFRGRLGVEIPFCVSNYVDQFPGYACLNTVLRNKKPASEGIFCSRTCRCVIVMLFLGIFKPPFQNRVHQKIWYGMGQVTRRKERRRSDQSHTVE